MKTSTPNMCLYTVGEQNKTFNIIIRKAMVWNWRYNAIPFSRGVTSNDVYDFPWWVQGSVRRQSYIVIRRMSPNITLHLYPYFVHIHFPGFSITTTYTTGNYFPLKQKLLKMTLVLCSGDLNYKWETRDLKGLRVDSTCDNLFQKRWYIGYAFSLL